jgi:hypothetical protein
MNFELRVVPIARRARRILLPSYITTICRATTLTGAAHSHKKKLTHRLIGTLPLRCYAKTPRIGLLDGAVRLSDSCCRWNASPVAMHSALTRSPSSVARAGKPSVSSSSQLVPSAISRLSHRRRLPLHRIINASNVRNGHRTFNEPGHFSPTFRHYGTPFARSSIEANIQWPSHSHA